MVSIRTETTDGKHQLIVTDDNQNSYRFDSGLPAVDLIDALNQASMGIRLTPVDRQTMIADLWDTITRTAQEFVLFDPDNESNDDLVSFSQVTSVVLRSDTWDNGRFPDGTLACYRGETELIIVGDDVPTVSEIEDGQYNTTLAELGGPFEGQSHWELVLQRPVPTKPATPAQ